MSAQDVPNAAASSSLDVLLERGRTLLNRPRPGLPDESSAVIFLLLLRDEIAIALRQTPSSALNYLDKIEALDKEIGVTLERISVRTRRDLLAMRGIVAPAASNWWWFVESRAIYQKIAILIFGAASAGLFADFAHRLLTSNPDTISIFTIIGQAMLTLAASSAFTEAGRAALRRWLRLLGVPLSPGLSVPLAAMVALFVVTLIGWYKAPRYLAIYYNNRGYHLTQNLPVPALAAAVIDYQRAISLSPDEIDWQINLADIFLLNNDYDKAAEQYRNAILVDPTNIAPYNDLANVLLIENNGLDALRLMDQAFLLSLQSLADSDRSALYKNLAWAEYLTGFNTDAIRDASLGAALPGYKPGQYCIIAKAYSKLARSADAKAAWQSMRAASANRDQKPPDSDCVRLAEEALDGPV